VGGKTIFPAVAVGLLSFPPAETLHQSHSCSCEDGPQSMSNMRFPGVYVSYNLCVVWCMKPELIILTSIAIRLRTVLRSSVNEQHALSWCVCVSFGVCGMMFETRIGHSSNCYSYEDGPQSMSNIRFYDVCVSYDLCVVWCMKPFSLAIAIRARTVLCQWATCTFLVCVCVVWCMWYDVWNQNWSF
jgi:hypothetical protein